VIVTDVRALQPVAPDAPPDWRTSMGQFLVAIDTDDGLTGFGVGGGGLAAVHIVRSVLRALLVGRDSSAIRELAEDMHRATLPFGRMGVAIMAISGVDLALWICRESGRKKPSSNCSAAVPAAPCQPM
jgi:L-rhamnonate dehydratase